MAAQDDGELFDLVDEDGRPLGHQKARALVHRDGDWHRSLHLWVVLRRPVGADVLFQRRSLKKDTQPGALDLAVAGHLSAGESIEDALREADEEIGLSVRPADVTRLGVRRRAHVRPPVHDREIQEVFLTVTDRPLEGFAPNPEEVAALLTLPLQDALSLSRAGRAGATATATELALSRAGARAQQRGRARAVTVTGEELTQADGYFRVALESIERHLSGAPPAPWDLRGPAW